MGNFWNLPNWKFSKFSKLKFFRIFRINFFRIFLIANFYNFSSRKCLQFSKSAIFEISRITFVFNLPYWRFLKFPECQLSECQFPNISCQNVSSRNFRNVSHSKILLFEILTLTHLFQFINKNIFPVFNSVKLSPGSVDFRKKMLQNSECI